MKVLIILFSLSLMLFPCKKNKDVVVLISAERQDFTGGTRFSASGTRYMLKMQVKASSDNLTFDSVFIKNRAFTDFSITRFHNGKPVSGEFSSKDTILLTFVHSKQPVISTSDDGIKNDAVTNESGVGSPFYLVNAEAIIKYSYKGKTMIMEVKKFSTMAPLKYP